MRTPLSGLVGALDHFSEMENLSTESQEMLQIGRICSEQLLSVINDVLDFSKIDAHLVVLDIQPCYLRHIIEESLEVISIQASKKGIPLICRTDFDQSLNVLIDHGRLRQILINLLSNSTKFTSEGEIILSSSCTKLSGGKCRLDISVKDSGIGISDSFKDRIFLPFLQSDSSITRKFVSNLW